MNSILVHFKNDEDGAVTVDWVVLTAAIVGMGFAVMASISAGALDYSTGLGAHVDNMSVKTY